MGSLVMRLWSDAFREEEPIPVEYTKDGQNVSPPLRWADLPRGTRELALIFEGITPATHEPWVHWLAYKIPADAEGLPKGYQHRRGPEEPVPLLQGRNSLGNVGYDGPQGTIGRLFRYRIRLLALDAPIQAEAGLDRSALEKAINGHVLDQAELYTRYERRG
ncbi:MAG TPA: YbhB/YbcL family Raf kinase inhibitor-like protein [Stellaceae bacterium]|nr:YbhB/YbcL family Raf kinase inhibitor-like protein [Stellaceae bacterium]